MTVVWVYRAFSGGSTRVLLLVLAVVFLVAMIVLLLLPDGGREEARPAEGAGGEDEDGEGGADGDDVVAPGEEFDAFADGFPVPSSLGRRLPPSLRTRRAAVAAVGATTATGSAPSDQEGTDD